MQIPEEEFKIKQNETVSNFIQIMNKFDDSQMILEKVHQNLPETYVIKNGFSKEECQYLRDNLIFNQQLEYKNSNTGEVYRKNLRTEIFNKTLAFLIFERIKRFLPKVFTLAEDERELGQLSKGMWNPSYLNPNFRVCKYLNDGFFGLHYDGCYVVNSDERSLFTLMFYLNGDFEEGETVFYTDEKQFVASVKGDEGLMIFFPQNLLHEGKAVKGLKWIFRTDLVFTRDFRDTNLSAENSEKRKKAIEYFNKAVDCERKKNGAEAVEYYRKAFKLDPDLEKVIK